ncbi:MAG: calcium-binding protein, partial [Betaproteobacteria bacterium]
PGGIDQITVQGWFGSNYQHTRIELFQFADGTTLGIADIALAFNGGDGQDTGISSYVNDTLSLGGGIRYDDLSFARSDASLVLGTGGSDQITLVNWYDKTASPKVINLQVITESMAGYNPTGSDPLLDNKVEQFDFAALASAFDAAGQVNGWALSDALLSTHLSGSDSAAIGGDLAYQYGKAGSLTGIGVAPAQDVINSAQFGSSAQTLHTLAELQQGATRLS